MKPTVLPLLSLALAAILPLPAQEAAEDPPDKPAGRLAWFAATGIPEDLENPVDVMSGKDLTQLTLARRNTSEPVKIPADGILRIVRRNPNPQDRSQPPFLTLAEARIPDNVAKALVILVPAPPEDAPKVFRTKVQSLADFKGGDTLYLNLTTLNVAVRLGDAKLTLKPGDVRVHSAPTLANAVNTPVSYHFFHPTDEQWKLLSASTVVLRPTRREICIFSWDPRFNRIDYLGITFPVER